MRTPSNKVFVSLLVAIAYIMGNSLIAQAGEEKIEEKAKERLAQIKVVSQYRTVTDGKLINRSIDDIIKIFKETKTGFIFQGWNTQQPCPENYTDLPSKKLQRLAELHGYTYKDLSNTISKIKNEMPNIIFCGSVQAEFFWPEEVLGENRRDRIDKAWEMVLDPSKWGLNYSKRDMQGLFAKRWGIIKKGEDFPGEAELKLKMINGSEGIYHCYFPDITNPEFQKILLKRIFKQIDAGVDAVWIDALYAQAFLLKALKLVEDDAHPAIQESYKAALKIVDEIHEYGLKKGKYIYVISWVIHPNPLDISLAVLNPTPNVDIAMTSIGANEIKTGRMNKRKWDKMIEMHRKLGVCHVYTRIDYGGIGRSPLRVFSQELTSKQQNEVLKTADDFLSNMGIKFIYPIRGGDMGPKRSVKKLAFGRFNWYDSFAPEFKTYKTIKELAQNRAKQNIQLLDRVLQDATE